ncbi:MAG: hypothetical protein JO040_12910 [Gemmatimonadetes bacterium]|nr:hypothetical protein [Gemmatimonadota bacterium]
MRNVLVVTLSLAALLGAAHAHAQTQPRQDPDPQPTRRTDGARALEYFVARNRMALGSGTTKLDGFGGRMMWSLASTTAPLGSRAWLGGYVVHTPEDENDAAMWHYGVQTDLRVAREPLAGRVAPLVSLGVGAVRVAEPVRQLVPALKPMVELGPDGRMGEFAPRSAVVGRRELDTRTSLSVVPGVGARVRLVPGLDFRSDVRMLIDFRDRTTRNLEVSGGISVPV